MKKIHFIIAGSAFLLIFIAFFVYREVSFRVDTPGYNNAIFTKELGEKLVAVHCWLNDTEVIISEDSDINDVYRELASLKLRKASPSEMPKEGHELFELETKNETIQFGLLAGEIRINGKRYYTNKDAILPINEIALKYISDNMVTGN